MIVSQAECKVVNDQYFIRLYEEIKAMICIQKGEIQ